MFHRSVVSLKDSADMPCRSRTCYTWIKSKKPDMLPILPNQYTGAPPCLEPDARNVHTTGLSSPQIEALV